jgi:hypothetical protein
MTDVAAVASGGGVANLGLDMACTAGSVTTTNLRATAGTAMASRALDTRGGTAMTVRDSAFVAGAFALIISGGTGSIRAISSEVDGGILGSVVCVGVYDETGAALDDGANGAGGCV